jgi:8-oxo-dGTP diphosphatase
MNNAVPVFGQIDTSVTYVDRPGAYGFLRNGNGDVAIIQTTFGFFLPGGGQDGAETPEAALRRELIEEIGYDLIHSRLIAQAIQYHWSKFYGQHFKKVGTFFEIKAVPMVPHPGYQNEHSLLWWPIEYAKTKLSQEFQRWATSRYQGIAAKGAPHG